MVCLAFMLKELFQHCVIKLQKYDQNVPASNHKAKLFVDACKERSLKKKRLKSSVGKERNLSWRCECVIIRRFVLVCVACARIRLRVHVCVTGCSVCVERDCIWVSVVKGNRTTAAAKALRFQLCAVIIRCIFSVGCCRFFVLARSGAFGWRSEILESRKLNLRLTRYFHVLSFLFCDAVRNVGVNAGPHCSMRDLLKVYLACILK